MDTGIGKNCTSEISPEQQVEDCALGSHRVRFYEQDSFLLDTVGSMMRTGLERGDTAVIVGTRPHLESIDRILKGCGFDPERIAGEGRYVRMNAAESLAKFSVNGQPDPALFDIVIGDAIRAAVQRSRSGRVRAYGEMVALSMARGERGLTLAIEELWNGLLRTAPFSLECGYPLDLFSRATDADAFEQVCTRHSHVAPAEDFSALGDPGERLRAIGRLQHKVRVLASETAARERAERELERRNRDLAQMQFELNQKAAQLSIAERRTGEFLAMLGHELRNPLSAVNNALAAAREDGQRGRALEIARRQGAKLGRLLDQLLQVSRVGQRPIALNCELVDLGELLQAAIREMEPRFSAGRHDVAISIAPDSGAVEIDADPARVREVIGHLMSNATRFTPPGGRIEVRLERRGEEAVLTVRDSGIGIPTDLLPSIFDPLVQAETSPDRPHGGLGTGLTVVKALVEAHGGRVCVRSGGIGAGSEFEASFPLAKPRPPSSLPAVQAPSGGARVLVVEDNADAAESLAMVLEMAGHQVRVVYDGFAALDAARSNPFDVFLVDIGLPGIDGYEVARRIRRLPECAGSRIVALTGYGQQEDRRAALSAGFDYHLTKPVDADRLEALLEHSRR